MDVSGLSLYQFDSCPFCQRVRDAMARLGASIELRDIRRDAGRRQELIEATGRATVPVLRIEEPSGEVRWMPESLDIVRFLEERFGR